MSKQPWALILGASSGFGEAAAIELARAGMNIFGVHMDRRDRLDRVEALSQKIRVMGREARFFNGNASRDDQRREWMELLRDALNEPPGTLRVLMHSLPFHEMKPLTCATEVATRNMIELTVDVMGNSLVYWVQDCLSAGLMERGARIFAMTSIASSRAIPQYAMVSAAKATLEAHIRQLAVELAPAGITANAILAGVTDSNSLRQMPGFETLMETARQRNPSGRLTRPEDVGRCIAALCHPATYWLTGNILQVDGGESIAG